jgi:hypothetical protein
LLLEVCEVVEAAPMFELLRLEVDDGELLSVDADGTLDEVLPKDELGTTKFVTDEETVDVGALENEELI